MGMDIRRSGGISKMRLFKPPKPITRSSLPPGPCTSAAIGFFSYTPRITLVRWYVCPPDAKMLPGGTIFGSSLWWDKYDRTQMEFGEDPYAKTDYDKGLAPAGATGQNFYGSPADFFIPKPWSPKLPTIPRTRGGIPIGFLPGLAAAFIMWGGPVRAPAPPPVGLAGGRQVQGGIGLLGRALPGGAIGLLGGALPRGAIGLSGGIIPADGALGLQGAAYTCDFCAGEVFTGPLRVTVLCPGFPVIDGMILTLNNIGSGVTCRWFSGAVPTSDGGVIAVTVEAFTVPVVVLNWNLDYIQPAVDTWSADDALVAGWTCNPFSFFDTRPMTGFISGPSGFDVTVAVTT